MGSVEKGNTVCDADPEERESRHSFSPAVVSFDHQEKRAWLVSTGFPEIDLNFGGMEQGCASLPRFS